MIEWLFRPCIEDYRGNWSVGYLNRAWIIFCIIANPITLCAAGLSEFYTNSDTLVIVLCSIAMANLAQQGLCELFWKPVEVKS